MLVNHDVEYRYCCTKFGGMDGSGIFTIDIDNKTVKRFSMETVASHAFEGNKPVDMGEYWKAYWNEMQNTQFEKRQEFEDNEFSDALEIYRNVNIGVALSCSNPLIRMFAILDRRAGKRTLKKQLSALGRQPQWLKVFYELRFDAEHINYR